MFPSHSPDQNDGMHLQESAGEPTDPLRIIGNVNANSPISRNVTRYIENMLASATVDGQVETVLRETQLPVFSDLAVFLASDAERSSVILPTGAGKTVLQAEAANAIFYGTKGQAERPKVLVLVPKADLIHQTAGEYDDDGNAIGGFARFAPDVSTSKYGDGHKDLSGDTVIMTYQSLIGAVKSGILPKFDVIIADEAHRSLGQETRAAVDIVTEGAKTIAFTASPDFNELKTVREAYGEVIREISLREGIELGMLSKLQVWTYKTNIKLSVPNRAGDFSEAELQPLINSEARNAAAVRIAATYVSQGLQGIVACLPGEDTKHAIEMAKRLNDMRIVDKDGVERNIVARSVSGSMTRKERRAIYKEYRAGSIDVLTYVDLLTEGWDAPNAKFIVNLRPTKSPVSAIQRLGRVLRLFKKDSVAQIVEFIDELDGADNYTAYHALGDLDVPLNNGHIYGNSTSIIDGEPNERPRNLPNMEEIADLISSCELEILHELYLGPIEKAQKQDIKSGRLVTIKEALGRIAALGGEASSSSIVKTIGQIIIGNTAYIESTALDKAMERYVAQEDDIDPATVVSTIATKLAQVFGNDIANASASSVARQLLNVATQTREFKAPGTRNITTMWKRGELESMLDAILAPSDLSKFQSIYDYYHDNNGQRVQYKRSKFQASQEAALHTINTHLRELAPEERFNLLRLKRNTFNKVDLVYSRAFLSIIDELRAHYIAK